MPGEHIPPGDLFMPKTTRTITMEHDTYNEMVDTMKEMGENPEERGSMAKYIEDAIKFKNGLVKANKWVPADTIDFSKVKIGK